MDETKDSSLTHSSSHVDDVISTALTSLTTISKTSRRPAFGAIFLLNNIGASFFLVASGFSR